MKRPSQHTVCPMCGKDVPLTVSAQICVHADASGFTCDAASLTPTQAARLRVDEAGRLETVNLGG